MRIAIGSDHRGVATKAYLLEHLAAAHHEVTDMGPVNAERVDYPDFAAVVASNVAEGEADRGILICGTGIGMAIAANKIRSIRAVVAHDKNMARISRQHNNANVLCLSGDFVTNENNWAITDAWLNAEFEGGRHQDRVDKIKQLEGRN